MIKENREKILFSKLLSTILVGLIFLLMAFIVTFVMGGILFGLDSLSMILVFNSNLVLSTNPFILIILLFICKMIEIIFYAILSVSISTLFKSHAGSIVVAMLIYFVSFVLTMFSANLGFLMFNMHPAKVFMGDTGSLALGGFLGAIALMLQLPLVLLIIAGICVIEALSDIIQVAYFKLSKGKKLSTKDIVVYDSKEKAPYTQFERHGYEEAMKVISVVKEKQGLQELTTAHVSENQTNKNGKGVK